MAFNDQEEKDVHCFFLCEEIVCFSEKCVVKQLTMETTSMFGMSTGLGEELGPREPSTAPRSSLGPRQCQQHKPGEVCSRWAGILNPAWHSLLQQCPVLARSSCPVSHALPAAATAPGCAWVCLGVPGCPQVSPRSPGWGTLCPALCHRSTKGPWAEGTGQ